MPNTANSHPPVYGWLLYVFVVRRGYALAHTEIGRAHV